MKINTEKVCCISDIHLGLHVDSPVWHKIALDYAKWLRDELLKNKIRDLIILGDINHNRNEISVTTISVLPKFFEVLKDFNIIAIPGNHDCYYNNRSDVNSIDVLNDSPNISVLNKQTTITAFGKVLTFCPWGVVVDDIPKSDILLGHFEIKSFHMTAFKICEGGINAKDLLEKSPLVLSGHFHITEKRQYQNGTVLYLGCPFEQNWGDFNTPKGYYLLDIPTGGLEFVQNKMSPRHKKIRLSEMLSLGITDDIRKEFEGNIVSFDIDVKAEQEVIDRLINKLTLLKPLQIRCEYLFAQEGIIVKDDNLSMTGVVIRDDIIEFVNQLEGVQNKPEVIQYLLEVLTKAEASVI